MKKTSCTDSNVLLKSTKRIAWKTTLCSLFLFVFAATIFADDTFFPRENMNSSFDSQQQNDGKVTGTITDTAGEPIIGANVSIKGTTIGIITDIDGKYSLGPIQNGQIMQISYIGYIPQEIVYTGQGTVSVEMAEDLQSLEEVVVVGYATIKKANLTGAVSAIDDKVLRDRPIVNLGQGLQGTIPNLNISTSGRPGDGSSYNIRGYTSINGGNPLVLVDGIERDPNLVNPQDVQSVSVLKDAASASIYGARAAYGVILITTKGGRKDQPTKVSFDATLSFNSPTTRPSYMNSVDYATWMNKASNNTTGNDYFDEEWVRHINAYYNDPANNSSVFVHSDPNISNSGRKYSYAGNTDWMKEMYKSSYPIQKYNVNIRGGGKKATYYSSVGYTDQGSLIKWGNEQYRVFNMVNNISYDVKKWLNVSIKNSYTRTELTGLNQNHLHGDSWIGGDIRPIMPVRHPDGNWSGQGNFTNFIAVLEDGGSRKTAKNDLWNTFAMKLMPVNGLSLNMDYTFNYYGEHGKVHGKEFNEYGVDGQFLQSFVWNIPNYTSEWQNNDTYNAFNLYGDYEISFDNHSFKVLAGFNQESKHTRSFNARRDELISNDLPSMGAAIGEKYVGNGDDGWATRSGFFRLNYTFSDRYLLELNGRYDLSSKFPKKDRNVFNPSFSAGWRVSEESWFKNMSKDFFNELKIRGSYGSLGNQALDNGWHAYISSYGTGNTSWLFNTERLTYVSSGSLVSNSITWETVTQWDAGLDFAILKNRMKGTFDFYQRKTTDMLTTGKVMPAILGKTEPQENAADLRTTGWECELSWNDQLSNGLYYSVGVNIADSWAEITKVDNPNKELSSWYVGQKIGEIWGYDTYGLFQSQDEIDNAADQTKISSIKLLPGDIRFKDLNGDNEINWGDNTVDNPGDKKIIGNNQARYRYGFNLSAGWKGADFSMFFQGVAKRDLNLPGKLFRDHYGSEWSVPSGLNTDYWTEDNRDAYFPVPRFNGGGIIGQTQTRYLQNAAYCRLKTLTLGYSLPQSWMQKLDIEKIRFYITGENIWTISDTFKGFDPELDDPYKYPFQKSFAMGLSVTF